MTSVYNGFYISGTLKKRLLAKYQEQTQYFVLDTLHFAGDYSFSYDGEFATEPFSSPEHNEITGLKTRQESLIMQGANDLKRYAIKHYYQIQYTNLSTTRVLLPQLENMIDTLIKSDRKFTYALFELLNWIIKNPNTTDIKKALDSFTQLCDFLFANANKINQIDLDFLIMRYMNNINSSWNLAMLRSQEDAYFGIEEDHLTTGQKDIIRLGKFVAPDRIKKIRDYIDKTNFSLMAPIFFLTKSGAKADLFLNLYRYNKDAEAILTFNCDSADISDDLRQMVRTRYLK